MPPAMLPASGDSRPVRRLSVAQKIPANEEQGTKYIALSKGAYTLVDETDYAWAIKYPWFLDAEGYAVRSINLGNHNILRVQLHRLIARVPAKVYVDHINQDKLDNRKQNLRLTDYAGNSLNKAKMQPRSRPSYTSKYKGVAWDKNKKCWVAYITIKGRRTHLGRFDNEVEAAKVYDAAAREGHGRFGCLNFPETP